MSLTSDTNKFIRANKDWLSDDHAPAVSALKILAADIDGMKTAGERVMPSMLAQYGLTYRNLLGSKLAGQTGSEDADHDLFSPEG